MARDSWRGKDGEPECQRATGKSLWVVDCRRGCKRVGTLRRGEDFLALWRREEEWDFPPRNVECGKRLIRYPTVSSSRRADVGLKEKRPLTLLPSMIPFISFIFQKPITPAYSRVNSLSSSRVVAHESKSTLAVLTDSKNPCSISRLGKSGVCGLQSEPPRTRGVIPDLIGPHRRASPDLFIQRR